MSTRTAADAVQRLKARYRRVHDVDVQIGAVKPLAFAELVFKTDTTKVARTNPRARLPPPVGWRQWSLGHTPGQALTCPHINTLD